MPEVARHIVGSGRALRLDLNSDRPSRDERANPKRDGFLVPGESGPGHLLPPAQFNLDTACQPRC